MQNWMLWAAAALMIYFMMKPSVPADARWQPADMKEALQKGPLQVVDVRTPAEFGGGHLAGAKSIPLNQLGARLGEIDKDKPVVLVCASGARSAAGLKMLRQAGYSLSKHLEGGLSRWMAAGNHVQR